MNIRKVLEKMIAARASDLHLKAGTPPIVRVDGILYTLEEPAPSAQEVGEVCSQLLTEEQREHFAAHNEIDFAFGVSGLARFRANFFVQRGTPAVALRHVPVEVPAIEDLNLPPAVRELGFMARGLILVTGRTGSGKSTTLAAMMTASTGDDAHIVTSRIRSSPVPGRMSFFHQREVGPDTARSTTASSTCCARIPTSHVGEIRDLETRTWRWSPPTPAPGALNPHTTTRSRPAAHPSFIRPTSTTRSACRSPGPRAAIASAWCRAARQRTRARGRTS